MKRISSLKSFVGPSTIKTLASAATLQVPEGDSVFFVSGTTGVASIVVENGRTGRLIELIGEDVSATSIAFTDTAIASAAPGTISLAGSLTLARGESVRLRQLKSGGWVEQSRSSAIA